MKQLLRPGVLLLNSLRYPQKFLLILLLIILPLFTIGYLLQSEMTDQIDFVAQERKGLDDIRSIRHPLALLQQHRGLSAGYLGGDSGLRNQLRNLSPKVTEAVSGLDHLVHDDSWTEIRTAIDNIQGSWDRISGSVTQMSVAESFEAHTQVIASLLDLAGLIAEKDLLIFDPEFESFYLIDLVLGLYMPLTESMGQARGMAAAVAARGFHEDDSRIRIAVNQNQIQGQLSGMDFNLSRVFSVSPDIERQLAGSGRTTRQAISSLSSMLDERILTPQTISISANEVIEVATRAIDQVFNVLDQTLPVLDSVLAARESHYRSVRAWTIFIMLSAVAAMMYLFLAFYRGVIDSIDGFQAATKRLSEGDLTSRFRISGKDELADVGRELNSMIAGFEGVVKRVMSSAEQVAQSAEELSAVTEQSAAGVAQQKQETDQVASAMNELSATVREVASNIAAAAEAANLANDEAGAGNHALNDMIDKVHNLAESMSTTQAVMSQLQDHSSEIGSVLEVINGIAEQTNLLALNAAIEAARAGDTGRGFAVVADEVRSLAARTQHSTEEISDMISRLQEGADQAAKVISSGHLVTQESVEMAGTTGRALQAIVERVAIINDMNTQVASAAEQQTTVADEMNRNVESIASVSEQAATASGQVAESSQNLSVLSQELLESVVHFRVA